MEEATRRLLILGIAGLFLSSVVCPVALRLSQSCDENFLKVIDGAVVQFCSLYHFFMLAIYVGELVH